MFRSASVLLLLTACVTVDEPQLETREQPAGALPWKQPAKWPHNVSSPRIVVHYQQPGDAATAQSVLADVEDAWTKQIIQRGSRPPLDDGGTAGPDGRFDVYLSRGTDEIYVAAVAANAATPYKDYSAAMGLDPWGIYGGTEMRANVFHEFRHASQAADDWYEHIWFFEAEATMWETAYHGYARLADVWADVQAHPDWTPFRDDSYQTWYMYGGALFLLYLRDHVFGGDLTYTNQTWLLSRTSSSANEPDFVDALGSQLAARGTSLFAELVSFARARWYTGPNANGTIESGNILPAVASTTHVRASGVTRTTFQASAKLLGTVYTVVQRATTDGTTARISLTSVGNGVKPVIQLVGQGAADRILDLSTGSATVPYVGGKAVIAVTMEPANGAFDPDNVGTQALKATIAIDR